MLLELCRVSPFVQKIHARQLPRNQTFLDHGPVARLYWLLVAGWRILILAVLARRLSTCFQLPATAIVLTGSNFTDILQRRTVAAELFKGVPLATFSSAARGRVLERLVREIDTERNPNVLVSDPELDDTNSRYRSTSTADFDWLRGGVRVECKSAQLSWDKRPSGGGMWLVNFQKVKFAFGRVRVAHHFDELYLALYTPLGIYVYRHDFKFGVCTRGRSTNVTGHVIRICGTYGEHDWKQALRTILSKLNSSSCEFIEHVRYGDVRFAIACADYPRMTSDAFDGVPLAELSQSARGRILEDVVRRIDKNLNPDLFVQNAASGLRSDGRRCIASCVSYDWLRGGERVECKSAQLTWHKSLHRWQVRFCGIRLFSSQVPHRMGFDDLLLAMYTPRGVYVIRHNLKFGISSTGRRGRVHGCDVICCGHVRDSDWSVGVDCILDKFVEN